MDRVALLAFIWFVFWTTVGVIIGRWLETPGFWTVGGFVFALLTVLIWPYILPNRLLDWMDE